MKAYVFPGQGAQFPGMGKDLYDNFEKAKVLLQSIPYDGTSTWGKGADKGFDVFMNATDNMEVYDIETNSEVYKQGIHILPQIFFKNSPQSVFNNVYARTKELLESKKFLTSLRP